MTPRGPRNGIGRPKGPPTLLSQPVSRILSGPSAAAAQRAMSMMVQRKNDWPYTHSYPPPQAVRVHPEGIIPAPAVATQTQVLQYQVPDGFQFAFTSLIALYSGAGFVLGSTDITWVLDVNTPIVAPAGSSGQGYPIQGMSPSNIPKGALSFNEQSIYSAWDLPMPEVLSPLDILRSKVTTTISIPVGAPNFFISIFLGWMWQTTK